MLDIPRLGRERVPCDFILSCCMCLVCPRLLVLLLLGAESEDKPGLLTQVLMGQGLVLGRSKAGAQRSPRGRSCSTGVCPDGSLLPALFEECY